MIRVILCEKPDQAKKYAEALAKEKPVRTGGMWQCTSDILSGELWIVSASGHLFEYENPFQAYENWQKENLPAIPKELKLTLNKQKTSKPLFAVISKAVKSCDEVIIATDSDREGERIAYTILSQIPSGLKKVKKRAWVSSQTKNGIQKAFSELREPSETVNFYQEAEARAYSDWLVGFNLSPAVSMSMKAQGKTDKAFSVGRVQTPTLALIVQNNESIEQFQSKPFWKIQCIDKTNEVLFTNNEKFESKVEAEEYFDQLSSEGVVQEISKEKKVASPPKLFTLTSLQSYGAKEWKKSSKEILEIVEQLYLKQYLSYPRTDSSYITNFEFNYLKEHLSDYQAIFEQDIVCTEMTPRKRYVDDKKVVEHYAIIPTEIVPNLNELTQDECLVYKTVVLRTLMMFVEDYIYEQTKVSLNVQEKAFQAIGNTVVSLGFRKYLKQKEKETILPEYHQGQRISVVPEILDDKTKPPAKMTESSLLGKYMPKYNLGTPATRANMLEILLVKEYIQKDKKTGQLTPTPRGTKLVKYLVKQGISFVDPYKTNDWEANLLKVGNGSYTKEEFIQEVTKEIITQVNKEKEFF